MKKQILKIGKTLNRTEQKQINGGSIPPPPGLEECHFSIECQRKYNDPYAVCYNNVCILS